jgi:hypothetical protein
MDIVDGQITDEQRCFFDQDFDTWLKDEHPLTLVFYVHGGLVDASTGLANALRLDPVLRRTYLANGVEIVPYYFIYHVGATESVIKGDRERGLFHLHDNAQDAVVSRFTNTSTLNDARFYDAREHDVMTGREDWMRSGLPPMSIVGKNGALAWAYMKQSILDGLDMTDGYMPSIETARLPIDDEPTDATQYLQSGPCLRPTAQELDPWPHILRNNYRWQDAGARDFLCRLGQLINARSQNGLSTKIVMIGHSTGSIYITQFIRKAQHLWTNGAAAEQRFHIIFLAPAVSYEDFDRLLMEAPDRIAEIRIFTMDDHHERMDKMLASSVGAFLQPIANYYDHSLLYAVSGIFEPNPDEPLIGLDRFRSQFLETEIARCAKAERTTLDELAEISRVRDFMNNRFNNWNNVFVLSPSPEGAIPPFTTHALDHGEFPGDPDTRASVSELLHETAVGVAWAVPSGANLRDPQLYDAVAPTPTRAMCDALAP